MYKQFFEDKILELKNSGQYRDYTVLNRIKDKYPEARLENGRKVIVWCSNDYLGMSQHDQTATAMIDSINSFGAGSGGSRNIGGTHRHYVELEQCIASWHKKDAALVFPTGYGSNDATLQCLLRLMPDLVVFSDERNHASIINGIRSTDARREIFKHNDLEHLESRLKVYASDCPKIIVFESIYSMDGDVAPVGEIAALAKRYNALTFLDEVHAVGMYGPSGAGVASALSIEHEIDIIQGTMAKAIGVIGGYIAGSASLIDCIRSFASGFIFTTSLPPAIVNACLTNIEHLRHSDAERNSLHAKSRKLRNALSAAGIKVMESSETHILPVLVGDAVKCKSAAKELLDNHDIYIQPINSPTVPVGTERFRINATPNHTDDHIMQLVEALSFTFNKLGIASR